MKFIMFSLFLFLLTISAYSVGDTIYFDNHWNKCTQEDAVYYRTVEISQSEFPFLVRDFYISGQLQMSGFYSSIDPENKQGEFKYFHENGNISQVSTYKDNELSGTVLWYYENGQLRETGNYQAGIADGENITYYDNGKIKSSGQYKKDKKNGKWVYRYKAGQRKAEGYYKKDSKHGLWKYWHKNGQLKCLGKHKNGLASGTWTYWHDNGNKQSQGKFRSGELAGKWSYWYETGVINMVGLYKKGELTGNWYYFDEEGQMLAQQNMKDNNLVITPKPELFDTTINFFADWNIGDMKTFAIRQEVKTFSKDSIIEEETTYYNVDIKITARSDNSYTAEWKYKDLYSKEDMMVSSLMKQQETDIVGGILKNLVFRCELNKDGSFRKLTNVENIKQQLHISADSIFKNQLENGELNLYTYNYKQLEQQFNSMKYQLFTDEFIQEDLAGEIKVFFNHHGKSFQTGQKIKMLSLVDFLGIKSPSSKFIDPVSLDRENKLFSVHLTESISPLNQFPGKFANDESDTSFKVVETNDFTFDYQTGWIQSLYRKNIFEVGELKTVQTLEIK